MLKRLISCPGSRSFFLFGARGVGKSTLVRAQFPNALYINLLLDEEEAQLAGDPDSLIRRLKAWEPQPSHTGSPAVVIIDEVQKVPKLLDIVHHLIEQKKYRFVLTGSSARKLKRGSSNLLAGRASVRELYPFTASELGENFDTESALSWGLLPEIYQLRDEEDRYDYLTAYARTYLKEEVWGEQLIRNLEPFRKFLQVAAQSNGKEVNFSATARHCGVTEKTVRTYFEILEDTLLGFFLEPFDTSVRKQVGKTPKFYFFDPGVKRALSGELRLQPKAGTSYYGETFEHLVLLELQKRCSYARNDFKLSFLRTKSGLEIDCIIQRPGLPLLLVEIKSGKTIAPEKITRFAQLANDFPNAEAIVLGQIPHSQIIGEIRAFPWLEGINYILQD